MSLPGIQIGPGITIGGGIYIGAGTPVASFTVNPGDITFQTLLFGGYSAYSSAGFTSTGTQVYNGISYTITQGLHDVIAAVSNAAGFTYPGAYAWNVTWATGSPGIARVGLDGNGANTLVFSLIDQTDTQWQTGNTNGPTQTGSFTFPATFTPYSPLTQLQNANNWC
jgi:hypothetical protein